MDGNLDGPGNPELLDSFLSFLLVILYLLVYTEVRAHHTLAMTAK
jgi:hypothetical protein